MKKILFLFIIWFPVSLFAQKRKPFFSRTSMDAGAFISTNGNMSALALTGGQYWGLGKKKKNFKVGLGLRLSSSFGSGNLEYITAPAILTSGKTGPGVFFADQIEQNIDTLTLNATQVNSLNLYLALRYDFARKWGVEFNIDLLGFSYGGKRDATLSFGDGTWNTRNSVAQPTLFNALLISDNDRGSLNSAFLIDYKIKSKIKLLAGASFLFNEYTIENPVTYINSGGTVIHTSRYRTKQLMFGLGITYTLRSSSAF